MLFKSTLAIAFVALASMVSASTPACVLSVIGDTSNPDDLPAICSSKTIQATIEKKCGDNADAGLKFFSNNCKSYGYTVAETSTSSDSSATTTGSSTTSTGSGFVTAVSSGGSSKSTGSSTSGSNSGSASGSASASASPTPSTAGAASGQQLSGTAFVAAMFLGAAALL